MSDFMIDRPAGGNRTLSAAFSTSDQLAAPTITTNETAFATSYAFPASYFTAGKVVRVFIGVEMFSTAVIPAAIWRARLQKAGPTNVNIYQTTNTAAGAAGTLGFGLMLYLQGTAAAGAAVPIEVAGPWINGLGVNARNTLAAPFTLDTSAALTLQLTLQYAAGTAGNTANLRQFIVEELG